MSTDAGKVYNVKHVNFYLDNIYWGQDDDPLQGIEIVGVAPDGFGVTPTAETRIIPGLKGEQGFSVDPSNGAEISLTVKSTSDSLHERDDFPGLLKLYTLQQRGSLAPFTVRIEVTQDEETSGTKAQDAFGFSSIVVENVMFVNYAPFETDEREAPDFEFEFIGYGLTINPPEGG